MAVRASMNADMKHDNLRAKIFRMATAAPRAPTPAAQAAARQAMAPALRDGDVALKAVATMKARPQDSAAALAEFDTAFKALALVHSGDAIDQGDGDLSRRLPAAAAGFGEMSQRFTTFLGKIAGVVGEVQGAAQEVRWPASRSRRATRT